MMRRLGSLLVAACDGLRRAASGSGAKPMATKSGVSLYLFAPQGASLLDERAARSALRTMLGLLFATRSRSTR